MLYKKHRAICTQLNNITVPPVHTNTQLYANNYITLLPMLYTQTHSCMHKIT